jgi:hypothetical protein
MCRLCAVAVDQPVAFLVKCGRVIRNFHCGSYFVRYVLIYRVFQKDVYTRLIFRIIMFTHLFGTLCIKIQYFPDVMK